MKKSLMAIAAAAALAAGTVTVPPQAEAHAWWWIPTAVVGGLVVGGAIAHSAHAYPYGSVYVNPANCRWVRERTPDGWRRVEVCR